LRPKLKASLITGGLRASDVARKSPAGRKPWDEVHQAGERRVRAIPANLASKSSCASSFSLILTGTPK